MARLMVAPLLLALAAPAFAQDEFQDARVRYLEPGVLMQRAGESGAEEAFANLPFLPGDRLWTDASGRAELQFEDSAFVRLDSRGKLDYVSHDQGRRNARILLRLWSGGVYFHVGQGRYDPDFELETPGGLVELLDRGVYRVDVEAGETRLSVYDGEASLDSGGRRVRVDSGERTYARRDEEPLRPQPFERDADFDEFARWNQEREDRVAWAGGSDRYLPEDVSYYGGELDESGSWYYEAEVGHVWRPYVTHGWRPYLNGHWVWTFYGWTWVPYEPWGWVTFHYGRWGYSPVIGWYWIPGAAWGPAWVSWAVGGDYVGWCPLGNRDRPVIVHESPGAKGHAVPRGSVLPQHTTAASTEPDTGGFVFVKKSDMGTRLPSERRFAVLGDAARSLRIADSPRLRPTRELKLSEAPATAGLRTVKTRPSFGDTVPELRSDPATTIPLRSWQYERERSRVQPSDRRDSVRPSAGERPTDLRSPRTPPTQAPEGSGVELRSRPRSEDRPTDLRSPRVPLTRSPEQDEERRRSLNRWTDPARPSSPSRDSSLRDDSQPQPRREPDHDVLKRFFQPLTEGRPRGSEGSPRSATPRSEPRSLAPSAPSRSEPRRLAPPPPPPSPPKAERPRPKKDKQN